MSTKMPRSAVIVLLTAAAMALIFVVTLITYQQASTANRAAAERQLQLIALDLDAALERHEILPHTLSHLPLLSAALQHPDQSELIHQLNQTFSDIQKQARVATIYLMDQQGKTLAASNWDSEQSYIGQNFSFRPYFRDAMREGGQTGHFYAIGNKTQIPGYFISRPVLADPLHPQAGKPLGVIVVKVSLLDMQQAWRSNPEPIALSDKHGVIFLGNRPAWQYRSLQPLDNEVQAELQATLQYAGKPVQAVSALPRSEKEGFGDYVSRNIGRLSWQLMLFPDQSEARKAAMVAAGLTTLLLILLATAAAVFDQRRQRLRERRQAALALEQAAQELESRIAQRTLELTGANTQLEQRLQTLQQTEQMLRTSQDELVQTAKLALLGQMAAGITHELSQPLTAIRAFSDNARLLLQRGDHDTAAMNLHHIGDAVQRMGNIISQLKGFARKSGDHLQLTDLNHCIQAAVSLIGNDLEQQDIRLQLDLQGAPQVRADPVRIEQILINLLRNAADAMEGQTVRCLAVQTELSADAVQILVCDTGPGIAATVLPHLFEPFFTTKPSGKGLGLGLAISLSIAQAMDGNLSVSSSADGACFCLRLPLADNAASIQTAE